MSERARALEIAAAERAAYVHIPFCRRRCPYCDFAVVDLSRSVHDIDRYVRAIVREIEMEERWRPLHAVNLGGGTPTALRPHQIAAIIGALRDRFGLVDGAEVSVEANPEDWSAGYAEAVAATGVNRVSLGVQSLDPEVLDYLGRQHTPEQALAAMAVARAVGMTSTNVDLIFGAPIETIDSWRATVARTLELEPNHLSAYALTVELGTELSRSVQAGAPAPDDDDQADKYQWLVKRAAAAGLEHYEVSNWALPGHRCRYNSTTWAHGEYVAFGTGAHGFRNGTRTRNVRRLDRYLEAVEAGNRPLAGSERLTGWERDQERLFVGLRRIAGARSGVLGAAFLESAPGRRLLDAGVIADEDGWLRVTNPLLTDAVARELLAFTPVDR